MAARRKSPGFFIFLCACASHSASFLLYMMKYHDPRSTLDDELPRRKDDDAIESVIFASADSYVRGDEIRSLGGGEPIIILKESSRRYRRVGLVSWESLPRRDGAIVVLTVAETHRYHEGHRIALCDRRRTRKRGGCVTAMLVSGDTGLRVCFQVPVSFIDAHRNSLAVTLNIVPPLGVNTSDLVVRFHSRESSLEYWRPHLYLGSQAERCPVSPNTQPIAATMDAHAQNGKLAAATFGKEDELLIRSDGKTGLARRSFLYFENVPRTSVLSLTLFVKAKSSGWARGNRVLLCEAAGDWEENGLSWDNQPLADLSKCVMSTGAIHRELSAVCFRIPLSFVNRPTKALNVALQLLPEMRLYCFTGAKRCDPEFRTESLLVTDSARRDWLAFFSRESPMPSNLLPRLSFDSIDCRQKEIPRSATFPVLATDDPRTLLVVSTCNEVDATMHLLASLDKCSDDFDVIFIDDFSSDGTIAHLRRRGYTVVPKEQAMGLTDSWNTGYEAFLRGEYDFLIIANNDILVPDGAITQVQQMLRHYPFMAPSTTRRGAGHNLAQSVGSLCFLQVDSYMDEASNFQRVQDMLKTICGLGPAYTIPTDIKFGGFFFGLRVPEVRQLEVAPGVLFDPSNILFGQERSMVETFKKIDLGAAVTSSAFIYHRKSVTVRKSGYKLGKMKASFSDLRYYHPRNSSLAIKLEVFREETRDNAAFVNTVAAFALSTSQGGAFAGDGLATRNFSRALSMVTGMHIRMLYRGGGDDWYDLSGIDILVALIDSYDLTKIWNAKPSVMRIAWATPPFDNWSDRAWLSLYDHVLSSSHNGLRAFRALQPFAVKCFKRCPNNTSISLMRVPLDIVRNEESLIIGGKIRDDATFPSLPVSALEQSILELYQKLKDRGILPPLRREPCHDIKKLHQLCVVVRTYAAGHRSQIRSFLTNVTWAPVQDIEERVFLVNTDEDSAAGGSFEFSEELKREAHCINNKTGRCSVHVLDVPFRARPKSYGYDATDWALETLQASGGCSHFLVTNGDNRYSPDLLKVVQKEANDGKKLIAWDFITHYKRMSSNLVSVQLQPGHIDLGSFVVEARVISQSGATFMPDGIGTVDVCARDWHFANGLAKHLLSSGDGGNQIALVHNVLLEHR